MANWRVFPHCHPDRSTTHQLSPWARPTLPVRTEPLYVRSDLATSVIVEAPISLNYFEFHVDTQPAFAFNADVTFHGSNLASRNWFRL